MFRTLVAFSVFAVGFAVLAEDANAQLLRRRGNCNSGCNTGCGVNSSGCNISGSQGCNISAAPQPTRATAEDLLQQTTFKVPAKKIAPIADLKAVPLKIDSKAALAFCKPVDKPKHALDLEKIVFRVHGRAPLTAVASR